MVANASQGIWQGIWTVQLALAIAGPSPYVDTATLSFSTFCFPNGFSFFDLDLTEPGCRKMWAAKH